MKKYQYFIFVITIVITACQTTENPYYGVDQNSVVNKKTIPIEESHVSVTNDKIINDNIVKIFVTENKPDFFTPWQMKGIKNYEGSGCIIGDNLILTNAHVVSDQTFITVKRSGQTKKYVAKLKYIAHDCDLAVLEVEDKKFFPSIAPLEFGKLLETGSAVSVYGYPSNSEQVTVTKGIISRNSYENYVHSKANLLTTQIDASINGGNSGGPVISNGNIVGIAMMSGGGENESFIVPAPVIKHFLEDISNGIYDGFPDLGLSIQLTGNPSLQDYYGVNEENTGVFVKEVFDRSPLLNLIFPGDLILAVDDIDIANDGTIEFRHGDLVYYLYAVHQKQIGDSLNLKILRNRQVKNVSVKLKLTMNEHHITPAYIYDKKPKYFIYGGIVFTTLNVSYMKEYDDLEWYIWAPSNFLYQYYYPNSDDQRKEIVIISDILSDEVNLGYEDFYDEIVTHINGKQIISLKFLIDEIERNKSEYQIIETDLKNKIILNSVEVKKSNLRIKQNYNYPSDRSEHFRK